MEVALIQWPSDESLRVSLAQQHHPRLLLVEPDADPPICLDTLEDWVRLPVPRADRNARIRTLQERAGHREQVAAPMLGLDGTLSFRGASAQLTETQSRVMSPLVDRFGVVVSREELAAQTWPGSQTMANTLDVTIGRLRRHIAPLGLKISTVRSRGYLLRSQ